MDVDVVIFGGGAAGLWLLDELARRGDRVVLLEAGRLGQGQTVGSQGIIHGGLKYTLQGLLTPAAREIRDMPEVWRQSLAGLRTPDLRQTRVRSQACHLWRSESLRSKLGMLGARVGLHVAPCELSADERPPALAGCPGTVARLDEQVISPASFVADLARQHAGRLLAIDAADGIKVTLSCPGVVARIALSHPHGTTSIAIVPRHVVLTAGAGNGPLRSLCGLSPARMQLRPLHMVLVRGDLPVVNGHCVDGARTRVTITADRDSQGRTVWQVGGQLAEDGVACDERTLVRRAQAELAAVLPGVDFAGHEWATYRVDRAELASPRASRPDTATVAHEGNVITAWPTKLALAPQLARMAAECIAPARAVPLISDSPVQIAPLPELCDWPRPEVAMPVWETVREWQRLDAGARIRDAA
ncbi:MAG: FAD-dependent oxidoreductase [Planctomycetia bacterium]|nr:FAD-dependent oxidoreductase [Planctomycetia bacterium]